MNWVRQRIDGKVKDRGETKMNRAERRRVGMKVVNNHLKLRDQALAKKQYGLGLIVTNLMIAVIFCRWTWTIMDRRTK
jgi:hypothetical protein